MRRRAYLKAIQEAKALPDSIPELKGYFADIFSPRSHSLAYIAKLAREDTDGLFDVELIDVINATKTP